MILRSIHCKPQIWRWQHPVAESEEELKSLLMKVKEESKKAGLKLSIQKTILASVPITSWQISSVQFSHSVGSDFLWPHEPQHARPPCPLPIPRVYPNSCPLSQWCHPTISSSVVPFSSCPQSFSPIIIVPIVTRVWNKATEIYLPCKLSLRVSSFVDGSLGIWTPPGTLGILETLG